MRTKKRVEAGGGAKLRLKAWNRRRGKNLGLEVSGGRPVPLIDQVHKLMQLWRAGDQAKVNDYLDARGLQRNALFHQILQALIELADAGSEERAILEALSNHAAAHGDVRAPRQGQLQLGAGVMTKRVLTVGCEIPGGLGEHISFQSKASLLDADFVLFCPTLPPIISQYREPVLSAPDSETLQLSIRHWERELTDVLNAGNTVFVLLKLT